LGLLQVYAIIALAVAINHRVFRYDAEHGFFAGYFIDKYPFFIQHPSLNQEAVIDAWEQVLELFDSNL
jgi:carboxymethylenebutenolidase